MVPMMVELKGEVMMDWMMERRRVLMMELKSVVMFY